jgi:UDP-galactopyranose mutase
VFQRPQHLLTRAADDFRVLFIEEPVDAGGGEAYLEWVSDGPVAVLRPRLDAGLDHAGRVAALEALVRQQFAREPVAVAWFLTPMALEFARGLEATVTVYDKMDELAAFKGADPRLALLERELIARADLLFTGGRALHQTVASRHANAWCHPSSVDRAHFAQALVPGQAEPADQERLARPRIGFFGVIDERMDMSLLEGVADRRPDLQFVMIGPVAKIDPATRPMRPNIHWLGGKPYGELPAYLGHWAAGFMPFALNESTRFISPTKTPEFLAAGLPLVSTAIADVVEPWGREGLVEIAQTADDAAAALDRAIAAARTPGWRAAVDRRLDSMSWTQVWRDMRTRIEERLGARSLAHA